MPKRSTAVSETLAPPLLGINAVDPVSNMEAMYALEGLNVISNNGQIKLRQGSNQIIPQLSASAGKIDLIANFGANVLMHGYSSLAIYDGVGNDLSTSVSRFVGTNPVAAQFNGNLFFSSSQTTAGPTYHFYYWNGGSATLSDAAFTGAVDRYKFVTTYRNRLYFTYGDVDPYVIAYGDPLAIAGTLTSFDLSTVMKDLSPIIFCGGMSRSGQETNEFFVIITSLGEVLVYAGASPEDVTWGLVNRYSIPRPVSKASIFYYGADILVLTYQGLLSLSSMMQGDLKIQYLSEKINPLIIDILKTFSSNKTNLQFASGLVVLNKNLIILSLPTSTSGTDAVMVQFVLDLTMGSWWKFTGLNGYSWANIPIEVGLGDEYIGFGTINGKIFQALYDNLAGLSQDISPVTGDVVPIEVKLRWAFNYFGNRSLVKQFVQATPIINQIAGLDLTLDVDVDYSNTAATSTVTDTSDVSMKLYQPRMGLKGIGRCASLRIDDSYSASGFGIQAVEIIYNEGDIT